jgi:hypothetical protein
MIEKYYNNFFEVYRVSSSINENNFEIENRIVNSSAFGYLEPLSGTEKYISEKKQAYTTHRLFCPIIDIIEKDEIHIGSNIYDIDLIQNQHNNHNEIILLLRK